MSFCTKDIFYFIVEIYIVIENESEYGIHDGVIFLLKSRNLFIINEDVTKSNKVVKFFN